MRKIKKYTLISLVGVGAVLRVTPKMLATILGYLAWTCKLKLLTYTYKSPRYLKSYQLYQFMS